MRISAILAITTSVFSWGTTAISGAEGVAEFQKLQQATTEYNDQLARLNQAAGLSDGHVSDIPAFTIAPQLTEV